MQKLIVFILITAIQFAIPALAQTIIKHYTTENGLNSNTAYASLSDVEGYLWFATDKGVSRFDGTTFTHFTTDDGLTDNEVFKIYQDKRE